MFFYGAFQELFQGYEIILLNKTKSKYMRNWETKKDEKIILMTECTQSSELKNNQFFWIKECPVLRKIE